MMQTLDYQEQVLFALRRLYDRYGYRQYKMSKFEEYDLYARNKDFLISDRVITFTDLSGKLMALKPDVTLSIVKNTADEPGCVQKLYYNENVYRVTKGAGAFRELMQVGLECLGTIDDYCICEVLQLAAQSLLQISPQAILDISHLGLMTELAESIGVPRAWQAELFQLIGQKNPHELEALCRRLELPESSTTRLLALLNIRGSISETLPKVQALLPELPALSQFEKILSALADTPAAQVLRIDFSVVDDVHYYNGFVFKGFIGGVPRSVLSGGQYDKLMKKMGRPSGAIGFAVYTDALERLEATPRQYDVDTVLLYPKDAPISAVAENVRALTDQGLSVLALSRLPEDLRCRQIVTLEVKDHA